MVLCNARYQVTTEVKWAPLLDGCDVIHNPNNINLNDIYSARLIEIQGHDGRARKVALVELVTSGFEPDNNFHKLFALPFIVSSMGRQEASSSNLDTRTIKGSSARNFP